MTDMLVLRINQYGGSLQNLAPPVFPILFVITPMSSPNLGMSIIEWPRRISAFDLHSDAHKSCLNGDVGVCLELVH